MRYLWAIMASLTWGLSYSLDEKALEKASFVQLLAVNAAITLVVITPIVLLGGSKAPLMSLPPKTLGLILLTSLLALAANAFIFLGIKNLGASTAAVIEISYPFFVILFSALLWKERPSISFFVGAVFIFFGSWIIARGHGQT